MNKFFIALSVAALLIIGFFAFNSYIYNEEQKDETAFSDTKDAQFLISGEWVRLENGISKVPIAPDSASFTTTQYFGNEAHGDIDGDGDEDMVFLISQDGGGSGIFFYLVGAINDGGVYHGTHAVFIGDRIAPQTTEFRDGQTIVNYADRVPGEAMAAVPSIGKSLYLKYDANSNSFGEVIQNFEGEVDMSIHDDTRVSGDIDIVDLSNQGLSKVPEYVFQKTNIETLNLSHNNLTGALQAEVRLLQNLVTLDLSHNQFTGVPAEVGQLTKLRVLNLSNNNLTGLPNELGNLKNLEVLDLRGNNYSTQDLIEIKKTLPVNVEVLVD